MTFPLFTGIPSNTSTCLDQRTFGIPSKDYDYPIKALTGDVNYPTAYGACPPMVHYNMRLGNLAVDGSITAARIVISIKIVTAPSLKGLILVVVLERNHLIFLIQLKKDGD